MLHVSATPFASSAHSHLNNRVDEGLALTEISRARSISCFTATISCTEARISHVYKLELMAEKREQCYDDDDYVIPEKTMMTLIMNRGTVRALPSLQVHTQAEGTGGVRS